MGVYRDGYRQYRGDFLPIRSRFGVIFSTEFQRLWRGRWNRRIVIAAAVPLIVVVAVLVGKGMVEAKVGALPFQLDLLGKLLQVEVLMLAILAAAAGAGILADDREASARLLYLARPLTPIRYLLGKGLALGTLLAMVYLLPAWVFVTAAALFSPHIGFGQFLADFGVATAGATCVLAVVTILLLWMSSLGLRSRYVGLGWFGLYLFSQGIAKGAELATGYGWMKWLGLPDLFQGGIQWFLARGAAPFTPVLILVGLAALSAAGLWFTVVRSGAKRDL